MKTEKKYVEEKVSMDKVFFNCRSQTVGVMDKIDPLLLLQNTVEDMMMAKHLENILKK